MQIETSLIRNKARLVAKGYAQEEGSTQYFNLSDVRENSILNGPLKERFMVGSARWTSDPPVPKRYFIKSGQGFWLELTAIFNADHSRMPDTEKSTSGGITSL
ncbi:hypothetical protein Tco_1113199 [Tanacetum coccineum]|uniref:Uncharacterized protein n=1 Tax=Tanacetum coccineum TaxID=301880 RepID=A0ABQ5IRH0_9ASTR